MSLPSSMPMQTNSVINTAFRTMWSKGISVDYIRTLLCLSLAQSFIFVQAVTFQNSAIGSMNIYIISRKDRVGESAILLNGFTCRLTRMDYNLNYVSNISE